MSKRDPFCSPKNENDFTLSGFKQQQKDPYVKPTHLAQNEEPWSRLHREATFSSNQRSLWRDECQPPLDSLDFHLKSVYDHHESFLWRKNQVLYQNETMTQGKRGSRQNEKSSETNRGEDGIKVWVDPQRSSIYSIK